MKYQIEKSTNKIVASFFDSQNVESWEIDNNIYEIKQLSEFTEQEIEANKAILNSEIYKQLDENQIKYLRSLVMPEEIKQPENITWTEYYKQEDSRLRNLLRKG